MALESLPPAWCPQPPFGFLNCPADFLESGKGHLAHIGVVIFGLLLKTVVFQLKFGVDGEFVFVRTCASLIFLKCAVIVRNVAIKIVVRTLHSRRHKKPVADVLFYNETARRLTLPLTSAAKEAQLAFEEQQRQLQEAADAAAEADGAPLLKPLAVRASVDGVHTVPDGPPSGTTAAGGLPSVARGGGGTVDGFGGGSSRTALGVLAAAANAQAATQVVAEHEAPDFSSLLTRPMTPTVLLENENFWCVRSRAAHTLCAFACKCYLRSCCRCCACLDCCRAQADFIKKSQFSLYDWRGQLVNVKTQSAVEKAARAAFDAIYEPTHRKAIAAARHDVFKAACAEVERVAEVKRREEAAAKLRRALEQRRRARKAKLAAEQKRLEALKAAALARSASEAVGPVDAGSGGSLGAASGGRWLQPLADSAGQLFQPLFGGGANGIGPVVARSGVLDAVSMELEEGLHMMGLGTGSRAVAGDGDGWMLEQGGDFGDAAQRTVGKNTALRTETSKQRGRSAGPGTGEGGRRSTSHKAHRTTTGHSEGAHADVKPNASGRPSTFFGVVLGGGSTAQRRHSQPQPALHAASHLAALDDADVHDSVAAANALMPAADEAEEKAGGGDSPPASAPAASTAAADASSAANTGGGMAGRFARGVSRFARHSGSADGAGNAKSAPARSLKQLPEAAADDVALVVDDPPSSPPKRPHSPSRPPRGVYKHHTDWDPYYTIAPETAADLPDVPDLKRWDRLCEFLLSLNGPIFYECTVTAQQATPQFPAGSHLCWPVIEAEEKLVAVATQASKSIKYEDIVAFFGSEGDAMAAFRLLDIDASGEVTADEVSVLASDPLLVNPCSRIIVLAPACSLFRHCCSLRRRC